MPLLLWVFDIIELLIILINNYYIINLLGMILLKK